MKTTMISMLAAAVLAAGGCKRTETDSSRGADLSADRTVDEPVAQAQRNTEEAYERAEEAQEHAADEREEAIEAQDEVIEERREVAEAEAKAEASAAEAVAAQDEANRAGDAAYQQQQVGRDTFSAQAREAEAPRRSVDTRVQPRDLDDEAAQPAPLAQPAVPAMTKPALATGYVQNLTGSMLVLDRPGAGPLHFMLDANKPVGELAFGAPVIVSYRIDNDKLMLESVQAL